MNYIRHYQLDLNKVNEDLIFEGTLYMEFYNMYRNHPQLSKYEQLLREYQQPNGTKNLRELTALNYRDHYICLS